MRPQLLQEQNQTKRLIFFFFYIYTHTNPCFIPPRKKKKRKGHRFQLMKQGIESGVRRDPD